jgi:hypothetical protein
MTKQTKKRRSHGGEQYVQVTIKDLFEDPGVQSRAAMLEVSLELMLDPLSRQHAVAIGYRLLRAAMVKGLADQHDRATEVETRSIYVDLLKNLSHDVEVLDIADEMNQAIGRHREPSRQ